MPLSDLKVAKLFSYIKRIRFNFHAPHIDFVEESLRFMNLLQWLQVTLSPFGPILKWFQTSDIISFKIVKEEMFP